MMAEPIVHSVVESSMPLEVNAMNNSINPRVAELLQSIYSVTCTAATSIGLGKAVDSAQDLQNFVDPDEVLKFSLEAGYEAVNKVLSDAEELARMLDIDLEKPSSYKLQPVFSEK